jgi:hypothetical protein
MSCVTKSNATGGETDEREQSVLAAVAALCAAVGWTDEKAALPHSSATVDTDGGRAGAEPRTVDAAVSASGRATVRGGRWRWNPDTRGARAAM